MTERVLLSLGSNLQPEKQLSSCARVLRARLPDIRFSRVYRCPAEGFDGADFLNAAALFHTDLPLPELHAWLQSVEADHGRTRTEAKFSDRTLDIDILLYGELAGDAAAPLKLPRPDLLLYPFVLGPACDLAPECIHPETGKPLQHHWNEMQGKAFILQPTELQL